MEIPQLRYLSFYLFPSWKIPGYRQHLSDVPLNTHTTSVLLLRASGISLQINAFQTLENYSSDAHHVFYKVKTTSFSKPPLDFI